MSASWISVALPWVASAAALWVWPLTTMRRPRRREVGAGPLVRALIAATAVGASGVLLLPSWWPAALAVGSLAGAAVWRTTESRPAVRPDELAMICELWAACLDAGMSVGGALTAALDAVTGRARFGAALDPTLARLRSVARLLELGLDAGRSWAAAAGDGRLEVIATAAQRSSAVGSDLAATLGEAARDERRAHHERALQRAARSGVWMTAPLTLCFLPAFVCLGLAPVVIALLDTLNIGW